MRMRAGVYDRRIAHMERGPPGNPEAVVLRRNNCGTRAGSRALSCHLMAVFAARTPCSRYPRFMARSGLNPYAAFGQIQVRFVERIADSLKEEAEEAVSPVWPLLSIQSGASAEINFQPCHLDFVHLQILDRFLFFWEDELQLRYLINLPWLSFQVQFFIRLRLRSSFIHFAILDLLDRYG